ncbi:UNVERIFIED_CONTAM: hypothetical protein GTU68_007362, partial [Idotea baltica]|nr:hypothetical protein [Idotea baltica]
NFGNPSAIHSIGRKAKAAIEQARKTIAKHLNASPSEIFFTSGGTEANNMALMGSVRDLGVKRIISCTIEHHCILHFLNYLKNLFEIEIVLLDVDENGRFDYDQLAELLNDKSKKTLVSLMHANNEIGTKMDLARVSALCHEKEALFHSDTVQTMGHFEFDLQATPIHFLACSAHKIHGPKGVGFIYINGDYKISPLIYGGSQERNMRAGTENICGIIGLAKAIELAYEDLSSERTFVQGLRDELHFQLKENIPGISFNGDPEGASLYTVLSCSFPKSEYSDLLLLNLDIEGICASGGSACASGASQGSHVIEAIKGDLSRTSIRFSFSKFNKKEDINSLIATLKKILKIEELALS